MIMIVQTDQNDPSANSYIDVEYLKSYATDRNIDIGGLSDSNLNGLILQAMDYLELRKPSYKGRMAFETQWLQWPRINTGSYDRTIPRSVKQAQAVLALEARTHDLMRTRTPQDVGAQTSNAISGAITKQFAQIKNAVSETRFTKAEALLAPLTRSSRFTAVRG